MRREWGLDARFERRGGNGPQAKPIRQSQRSESQGSKAEQTNLKKLQKNGTNKKITGEKIRKKYIKTARKVMLNDKSFGVVEMQTPSYPLINTTPKISFVKFSCPSICFRVSSRFSSGFF